MLNADFWDRAVGGKEHTSPRLHPPMRPLHPVTPFVLCMVCASPMHAWLVVTLSRWLCLFLLERLFWHFGFFNWALLIMRSNTLGLALEMAGH
jgi:hypothetical protein